MSDFLGVYADCSLLSAIGGNTLGGIMRIQRKKVRPRYAGKNSIDLNQGAKIELIRKFQRLEGNYDCCASAYVKVCLQAGCLWRAECRAVEIVA